MFDHVGIKFYGDLGQLAEAMLFYNKITLFIIDEMPLRNLFKKVHPKILIPFLEEHKENINICYLSSQIYNMGLGKSDDFSLFLSDETHGGGEHESYLNYLSRTFSLDTPDGFESDKYLTNKLLDIIKPVKIDWNNFDRFTLESVSMHSHVLEFTKEYVKAFYPEFQISTKNISISIERKYYCGLNIKIRLSKKVAYRDEKLKHINEAIFYYFRTMSEIHLWSTLSAEYLTSDKESFVLRHKVNNLFNQKTNSQQVIDQFQDIFIPEAKNISDVINSGTKSFHEYLSVYEKGEKFRGWVKQIPYDTNLMKEYYRTVFSNNNWLEKLPAKTIRWVLFTGAGLGVDALGAGGLGTLSGVALGVLDTFILDKIIKGWKPNQFINNDVRPFIQT